MGRFEDCEFDLLTSEIPGYPFFELWGIAWDAREILEGLPRDVISSIEHDVEDCVYEMKQSYVERNLDEQVARIIENGSWELRYLPEGGQATPKAVRILLENWPDDAEEKPDLATDDDLTDADAFRMAVYCGKFPLGGEWQASSPTVGAAVLALGMIAECVHTLRCPEDELGVADEGPIAARFISAANSAIGATLALSLAKEFAAEIEARADSELDLEVLLKEQESKFNKDRALKAALARHSRSTAAKHYVQSEWLIHGRAYSFNKSDFARTYVTLVSQNFCDKRGDPLSVTTKTISEVWLIDTPTASKQAG
jgi:hypothetical protein